MKPILLSLAVLMGACAPAAVVASAPAAADPVTQSGDGQISVKPGRYSWKQKTEIVGFGSNEDNIECLIQEKATITLSKLARDLDKGCSVANVVPTPDGYKFRLICNGKIPGTAEASLVHTDTSMTIKAKGSATVIGFVPAGFSMQADATRVGDCSEAEIAREKDRMARKAQKEKG